MAVGLHNNLIREWLMRRRKVVALTLRYVAAEKRMVDENQEWASAIAEERRKRLLAFLLDSYEDELGKIESALARVGTDDYGRCRLCRKPIDRRRLERLPIADLCFGCEKREQQKERNAAARQHRQHAQP